MTSNNPPPVPLLNNLGSSIQARKDIDSLRNFLYLIWVRVGGGEDLVTPSVDDNIANATAVSYLTAQLKGLKKEISDIQANHGPDEVLARRLMKRVEDIENSVIPQDPQIKALLSRVNDIEAQL